MFDYFSLILWILIAVIGLVIYVNPSFWVRTMYEGFEEEPPKIQNTAENPVAATVVEKPALNTMLRNLEQLIATPGIVADTTPGMLTEVDSKSYTSNNGRQQPAESESNTMSKPKQLDQPEEQSNALKQGKVFQRVIEVPVPRICPQCPTCPNMRDYIRKDSIPCWSCKL